MEKINKTKHPPPEEEGKVDAFVNSLVMPECFNRASIISTGYNWIPAQNLCGNDNLRMHQSFEFESRPKA